jgi:hypothetical protein
MTAIANLVHQTATTTGTGNLTLVAENGKQSFNAAFGTGGTDAFYYFISNRDAAEWEHGTGHLSDATTLVRDTVLNSSNSDNAVSFSAGTKDVINALPQSVLQYLRNPTGADANIVTGTAGTNGDVPVWDANGDIVGSGLAPANFAIAASVGSSALTVSLTTPTGSTPSATSPVSIPFRSSTATTGTLTTRVVTAATTLVISSGSTMGFSSATPGSLWLVAFDDAGTVRLGLINCLSGVDIYPLAAHRIASSTAEGGAGGADSAHVFYTGTAVTSKAYAILGRLSWETGLTTAGTWDAVPTRINLALNDAGVPGQMIQSVRSQDGTNASGTTTIPIDNTIPQNTEGVQFMTQAITPKSACNILRIKHTGYYSHSTVNSSVYAVLFQDSTASALATGLNSKGTAANGITSTPVAHTMLAATTSSTTFKIRAGNNTAGTVYFNSNSGGQFFGGTFASELVVEEICA